MYSTSLRAATRGMPQCTRVLSARFRGRVNARCPSGVIVIARPAVARVRSIVGAPCTRTRTSMHIYVGISSRRCGRHRYIPAPGTNIIACRDKFIADVPQPTFANVPRLRRKTEGERGRRARSGKGRKGGRSLDISRNVSGGRYNEISRGAPGTIPAVSLTLRTRDEPETRKIVSRERRAKMRTACEFAPLKEDNKSGGNSSFRCYPLSLDNYSLTR